MGDNFGPEFGARIQLEFSSGHPCNLGVTAWKAGKWDRYDPEALLHKSEIRKPSLADCDNVTRFLMAAGYRAVVPGREDFLYTGTWLRRIAYLLRGASPGDQNRAGPGAPSNPLTNNGPWTVGPMPEDGKCSPGPCAIDNYDHRLHMLAANLRVSIPAKDVKPPAEKYTSCPLLFAADLGAPIECNDADPSISAAMGWLTRVDGALQPEISASIEKQAQSSHSFASQLIKNEISILQTIVKQPGIQASSSDKAERDALEACLQPAIFGFNPDAPAAPGSSCVAAPPASCPSIFDPLNTDLRWLVQAMEKATTYFRSPAKASSPLLDECALRSAQRLLLQLIYKEQLDTGFTIATIPGSRRVLIIGVVGKETMQEVGPDFFSVYPDTFDCDPASGPSDSRAAKSGPNPVCVLKQKLWDAKLPPGSVDERNWFRQAAGKDQPYKIAVGDPLVAAEAVLRAVWANQQREKWSTDRTILMAQMPATEAEEVGDQLRDDFGIADSPMFFGIDDKMKLEALKIPEFSLRPRIDLVLGEAQLAHTTGNQVADINPSRSTVVLSPPLAYESVSNPKWYPPSTATISESYSVVRHGVQIRNTLGCIEDSAAAASGRVATTAAQVPDDEPTTNSCTSPLPTKVTAATLLESMLATDLPRAGIAPPLLLDLTGRWEKCNSADSKATANCQSQVLTNYLLHTLQIHDKSSAAMLKRRDLWFGNLASGYDDYSSCENPAVSSEPNFQAYCKLHAALDRVLWRRDYAVRVLVDGTTLASVLKASSQATAVETTRLANDIHQEWLSTFGVVSTPPKDLVAAASGPERFSLPGVRDCNITPDPPLGKKPGAPTPKAYCVDGFTIAPDAAYWISTSAQLAKDPSTYKDIQNFIQNQPHSTRFGIDTEKILTGSGETFLATAIANEIIPFSQRNNPNRQSVDWGKYAKPDSNSVQDDLSRIETASQRRRLMQLDISKFAAGYTFTAPSINDSNLGNNLSGVSNTQATTPHSAELDLEAAARTITAPVLWQGLAFGVQNDFEFDHKRTGNTSGKPATVSYQLNSETAGAFAQIHIPQIFRSKPDPSPSIQGPRDLPRLYWVIAPYQYQRQIVGSPLYFGYLTPPYAKNPSKQLTVNIPVSDGFNWKSGLRFEAGGFRQAWAPDSGSYAELGPEYVIQNNILSGISMPDLAGLSGPKTTSCSNPCPVTAGTSITSAVQGYYKDNNETLNGSSHLVPLTRTVHAGGFYWTAHVQKVINKAKTYSVSFDTAGDSYLLPGYTLPTQTRYAINNKLAFNMNFLGNLSFSPTYSVFNFENQGVPATRVAVNTTSFEVMLKWYFSRDTQSPPFRMLWFTGPKSADQTASTKLK